MVPLRNKDTHWVSVNRVLSVFNLEICDQAFSDHMTVLFDITPVCQIANTCAPAQPCLMIYPSIAVQSKAAFNGAMYLHATLFLGTDELASVLIPYAKPSWTLGPLNPYAGVHKT